MRWHFLGNVRSLWMFQQESVCCDLVGTVLFADSLRDYNRYVATQEISSEHLQFFFLFAIVKKFLGFFFVFFFTKKSEH